MTGEISYGILHGLEYQEPMKKIQEALGVCSSAVTFREGGGGVPPGAFLAATGDIWGCLGGHSWHEWMEPGMLLNTLRCSGWLAESDRRWRTPALV